ncbi:MAG: hypothetical protein Q9220_005983 [cf. Caloplaca sp. 1 TL-2023]
MSAPTGTAASTAFQAAIHDYLQSLPKKSNKRRLLVTCINSGQCPSPRDVEATITQLEQTSSQKPATRRIRKCLTPVISALSDYSGILDTLVLKQIFKSSGERVQPLRQVDKKVMTRSSRLIDKAVSAMFRSIVSFSTTKLDNILGQLRQDADDIEKLVPIVQERIQRGERENAEEERKQAGIARSQLSAFIQEQRDDKVQRDLDRKRTRQKEVREWLRASNESNIRHQTRHSACRHSGTCEWLTDNDTFMKWVDCTTEYSTVWLSAAPGMGKSVLTAYTVEELRRLKPQCAAVFHYYRFDEMYSAIETYRNLAEQLFDQIWNKLQDVPENIHAHIQASSGDIAKVKQFIELSIAHMAEVYVFFDGLDEECDQGEKWTDALEVLEFVQALIVKSPRTVRLWCSSQDRLCVRNKLKQYPVIDMSIQSTDTDVSRYLTQALQTLDVGEVDPGTETILREDLKSKARGNFLWAHLMVRSLEQADSLDDIMRRIQEGLPLELDKYYERIFLSISVEQRSLACKIFSIVAFAKRPLLLEELSEAIGMTHTEEHHDLDSSKEPFKRRLKELCAPLIDVDESSSTASNICTLTHSTVKSFLFRRPDILQSGNAVQTDNVHLIDEVEIASACLKYLSQPRYGDLMLKSKETVLTRSGENVAKHHLLSYAAKYWDKHLDNVDCDDALFTAVESFLVSPQFVTCVQVQSLFVEGQFSLWVQGGQPWAGYRRTFPRWFTDCGEHGRKYASDYSRFVAEWGPMLNTSAGEPDRCLWKALGPKNFLSSNVGRYQDYMYVDDNECNESGENRYYNEMTTDGTGCGIMRIEKSSQGATSIPLCYSLWKCTGCKPAEQSKNSLQISKEESNWHLYNGRLRNDKIVGRPPPVSSLCDSSILRVGTSLWSFTNDSLTRISGLQDTYFEDAANQGSFLVTSTRRRLSISDIYSDELDISCANRESRFPIALMEDVASSQAGSNQTDTATTTLTRSTSDDGLQKRRRSSNSSMTSLDIGSVPSDAGAEYSEEDEDIDKSVASEELQSVIDDSCTSNSAYESCSNASTDLASDEIEEDDHWNDFASSASDLAFSNDLKSTKGSDDESLKIVDDDEADKSEASENGDDEETEQDYLKRLVKGAGSDRSDSEEDSDRSSSSNSDTSSYESDTDDDDSDSDSDSNSIDSEAAQDRLERIIWGKQRISKSASRLQRGSICVYHLEESQATPMFRFSIDLSHVLFESPPVLHPSASLLVWPLHQGEILFADFLHKTYFTRTLRPSKPHSCYIFIKCHFSRNGHFLHIAALEARPMQHKKAQSSDTGSDDMARVVVGSRSATLAPSKNTTVVGGNPSSPPIGFLVSEERDLGGWKDYVVGANDDGEEEQEGGGGRLQGKYERFDTVEDCDIVPYLF